jgi:preprotein translocase subunit Sec63
MAETFTTTNGMRSVSICVCLFTIYWIVTFKSVFPRMNVRDPYKRLGISREAGEEEIREARSYLANQVPSLPMTFVSRV